MTFAITVHTKTDECFCHIASTLELGVKWIEKYGGNWCDDPYAFIVAETEIDKDDFCDKFDNTKYFSEKGIELNLKEFHNVINKRSNDELEEVEEYQRPLWYCQMCGQESCSC